MIAENTVLGNWYTAAMTPVSPGKILRGADVSALLISDLVNIRYLTGLSVSSGLVLLTKERMTLFTDARYLEVARRHAGRRFRVSDGEELALALRSVRICGVEGDAVTLSRLAIWKTKFKNTKFVRTSGIIEQFRRSKDDEELRAFRRAQRITCEILRRVPMAIRRPIRETDLAWQLEVWARELGAEGMAFPPIVAFGTHSSSPHHHPTSRMLRKGHIVQVDCGARYRGYCADQSAVFFTAQPTALERRVHEAVCAAKDAAMGAVKPGASTRSIDRIARDVLKGYGLEQYFCHALGHGVGLEIHEGVTLSTKAPDRELLKNEIITIEPGVYIPGRFGMRLEEELVVGA